jgi:hypothetical protein
MGAQPPFLTSITVFTAQVFSFLLLFLFMWVPLRPEILLFLQHQTWCQQGLAFTRAFSKVYEVTSQALLASISLRQCVVGVERAGKAVVCGVPHLLPQILG